MGTSRPRIWPFSRLARTSRGSASCAGSSRRAEALPAVLCAAGHQGPLRKISSDESQFDPTIIAAATPLFQRIFTFVQNTKTYCDEAVGTLNLLFEFDLWSFWKYSVELIDRACELYLTMQMIDELKLVKTSFTNDFTFFIRRCDLKVMQTLDKNKISEVSLWLASHGSVNMFRFKKAGERSAADRALVAFAFMWEKSRSRAISICGPRSSTRMCE
jgi:hypothetical protein